MNNLVVIDQDDLKAMIADAISAGVQPLKDLLQMQKAPELPKPRSEIMEILKIKDGRTFNKKVKENEATACGTINNEPAYYISQFFKKAG